MISIHALVKRATEEKNYIEEMDEISIHALVKRATNIIIFVHNLGFISIHALVKRATNYKQGKKGLPFYFNPRPREEGDSTVFLYCISVISFQSTPS